MFERKWKFTMASAIEAPPRNMFVHDQTKTIQADLLK